jgi:nitroreductase/dihydropteridine reductase
LFYYLLPMTIHELLLKRFATKKFDPTKKVSEESFQYILECARLSCSSMNTQPWKLVVISNPELRQTLRTASYGQAQISDASHLVVLCTMKHAMDHAGITTDLIAAKAGTESAEHYKKMVQGSIPSTPEKELAWLQRQVYLPLQAMILAAIEQGIDSCPMEGFKPEEYTKILGLTDCVPTVLLTLGYAAAPGFEKVRLSLDQIVEYRT